MAHNLTPANSFDTTITVPDDGDGGTAASVNGAFQALANRTQYLNQNYLPLSGGALTGTLQGTSFRFSTSLGTVSPTNYTRLQSYFGGVPDGNQWKMDVNRGIFIQNTVSSAGTLYLPLNNIIDGSTLTSVTVTLAGASYSGAAGHGGSLPATMPTLKLYRQDQGSPPAQTQIGGTTTDSSANAAAYDAAHSVTISGLSEAVVQTKQYYLLLTGEASTNSVANTTGVLAISAVFSTTFWSPGG
jgi:hypothetical protein